MVRPAGFEPTTPGSEDQCSNPLSYGRLSINKVVGVTGLEPATSRPPAVRASQLRHTPTYKAGQPI